MKKITVFLLSHVFILGCSAMSNRNEPKALANHEAMNSRSPANQENYSGGKSNPENSRIQNAVVESSLSTFSIKENDIKITQMTSATFSDRVKGKYDLEIDGLSAGSIISAVGQFVQNDKNNETTNKSHIGRVKYSNITIERDWSGSSEFYKWQQEALEGKATRKSVSIIFHNDAGEESRLNFYHCWPSKWSGPALNSRNSGHASEKIELTFENYEIKSSVVHL